MDTARLIFNWRCLACGIKGNVAIDFPITPHEIDGNARKAHLWSVEKFGRACSGNDIQIIPEPGKIP